MVFKQGQSGNPSTQFKPGESGNPAGKPRGVKHISTWIQEMAEDEEFSTYLQDAREGFIEYKGAPLKAIIKTALVKAVAGDKDAREWLAKYGWRKELDITSNGKDIVIPILGGISATEDTNGDIKEIEGEHESAPEDGSIQIST